MQSKKLILLNGNPGMGKTTLAKRYVDEHPMTLNLDIDNLWIMMGQRDHCRPESEIQKLKYAYAIADMHLADSYDVIVPNLMQTIDQYKRFEQIARVNNAVLKECALLSTEEDAIERCKARGRAMGYADGFRPGGTLDRDGREAKLADMHRNMLATIAIRENIVPIHSVQGDTNGAYAKLIDAVS